MSKYYMPNSVHIGLTLNTIPLWSTCFGNADGQSSTDIAVDQAGNIIIVGNSSTTDLPEPTINPGYVESNQGGFSDGFIVKFDDSQNLIWTTQLGSDGYDIITSLTLDNNDNIYVSGRTDGTSASIQTGPLNSNPSAPDFPIVETTSLEYVHGNFGQEDHFVCKFNSSNELEWSTMLGGTGYEEDDSEILFSELTGELYFAGVTTSTDIDDVILLTSDMNDDSYNGSYSDLYLTRFNLNLDIDWQTYIGGNNWDDYPNLTVNSLGDTYIGFGTRSSNISTVPSNTGAYYDASHNGDFDAFIIRVDQNGNREYATYIGGTGSDIIGGISYQRLLDNQNDLVFVGSTKSLDYPIWKYPSYPGPCPCYFQSGLPNSNIHPFITNFHNVSPWLRISTDLVNKEQTGEFEIYPIPNNGIFTIETSNGFINKIEMFDPLGKIVFYKEVDNENKISCDASSLNSSIYFLNIVVDDEQINKKVIISK